MSMMIICYLRPVQCQAWGYDHANLTTSIKVAFKCHFQTQPKDIRKNWKGYSIKEKKFGKYDYFAI